MRRRFSTRDDAPITRTDDATVYFLDDDRAAGLVTAVYTANSEKGREMTIYAAAADMTVLSSSRR